MCVSRLSRALFLSVLLVTLLSAGGCKEEGGVRVENLSFEGTEAVDADQLKSVLATAESSWLPWGTKRYFSREQFEADLKRIVAFYRDRGFPEARVASFDVKLSEDQSAVDITVRISEGEPIRIERVDLVGFEPLPEWRDRRLRRTLPLAPGQPLDRALLQASRESALDALRDHGHPYASVKLSESPGTGGDRSRVIALQAEPGPIAYHGPIEIAGNSSVSDSVIRRQLTFRPGDVFSQSRLLESQRRLYALEVFEFANVEPMRVEGERPAEIPTRVTVTEGKHRKVNFSVGYGTEEKARVEADWRHVNFFGGARTAGVLARYSGLDRGVRLNLGQPYFFSPLLSLSVSGQYWHNDEPDVFTLDNVGGRVTITREFGRGGSAISGSRPGTTLAFTYANEYEEYSISNQILLDPTARDDLIAMGLDPRTGKGRGQRSSIGLDAGRNTTRNVLDARRGYVAAVHLEQAGKYLGGDYDYYEVTGEARYYRTVAGRAVVAARARAGSIDAIGFSGGALDEPPGTVVVPFYKRYFLGGATNLRGWGRFEVAPLSGFGLPLGGHSFANFSTEVRVPIWRNLSGVIFLDGGNVWSDPWDLHLNDLRYDAGPGLRYATPIGPFRVDFGYQLNPIEGLIVNGERESRRFRIHFSIGQAF
jgi:outer membrane protein insertion porin family/translocation and assembly module TamA